MYSKLPARLPARLPSFINRQIKMNRHHLPQSSKPSMEALKKPSVKRNIQENPTIDALKWRIPKDQKQGEFYSKLKIFAPEKNDNAQVIKFLQTSIDLRPSAMKKWFKKKQVEKEKDDQRFIPERHEILGNDLAAAHFIVHRGGAVKFYLNDEWIRRAEDGDYSLPKQFAPSYLIESLDCEGMNLQYEGIENLKGLKRIKRLNLKGCSMFDDWCLDRVSGLFCKTLEELDISDCPNITANGLQALYRMNCLKKLRVDKNFKSKETEMILLLLEEQLPSLTIELRE